MIGQDLALAPIMLNINNHFKVIDPKPSYTGSPIYTVFCIEE